LIDEKSGKFRVPEGSGMRPDKVHHDLAKRIRQYWNQTKLASTAFKALDQESQHRAEEDRREWIEEMAMEVFDPDSELLEAEGYKSKIYDRELQKELKKHDQTWRGYHPQTEEKLKEWKPIPLKHAPRYYKLPEKEDMAEFGLTPAKKMEGFVEKEIKSLRDIPASDIKALAKEFSMRTASLNRALKHVMKGDIDALRPKQQKAVQKAWPGLFGKLGKPFEYCGTFSEKLKSFSESIDITTAKKEKLLALLKSHGTKENPTKTSWGSPCKASFKSLTGMPFLPETVKKAWGME